MNQHNKLPTVSIGMPVYNGEKYIKEALDSLLAQTFTDFELIISDNASIDATETICQNYVTKDARIRYIRQEKNLGAIANFKIVLNQAVGVYFMWAAYDDKWSIDWLEQLQKKLITTGAGMAFGRVVHIDSTGAFINHPANYMSFRFTGCPLYRRVKFYVANEALGKANTIYSLYKREMLVPLNMLFEEFCQARCFYDYTIVYGCLAHQTLEKSDNIFIYKRIHEANEGIDGSTNNHNLANRLKIIQRLIWPFLPNLLWDYLSHSSFIEKIVLLLFFPVKLFNHYCFILNAIVLKIKALNN